VKETGDHGSFNSWGRDRYWGLKGVNLNTIANSPEKDLPLLDVVEPNTLRNSRWRCDHGWDIDLDDGSSNYHIYDNLCLHGGIKNREGFDRTVENNICVGNTFHSHVWFADSQDVFSHNIVCSPYKPIGMPAIWGKEVDYNLLEDPRSTAPVPAIELQKISKQDTHSIKADAMFVDPSTGDYTVKPGSPALALGFKNFAMDQFGVQSPALKTIARVPSFTITAEETSTRSSKVQQWMGARVRNIVGQGEMSAHGLPGETGVMILEIASDGPLAKAGVAKGDVILSANGKKIDTVDDLPPSINSVSISRDQNIVNINVK
jgi:hypothetical protein